MLQKKIVLVLGTLATAVLIIELLSGGVYLQRWIREKYFTTWIGTPVVGLKRNGAYEALNLPNIQLGISKDGNVVWRKIK